MARLLSDEYGSFTASYDAPPGTGLRVNSLKISTEHFRKISPFSLEPLSWVRDAFLLPGGADGPGWGAPGTVKALDPGRHPHHAAGLYYLQDPSAMVVAEMLDPQPGERVLDLAAAPGGKATHIASLMRTHAILSGGSDTTSEAITVPAGAYKDCARVKHRGGNQKDGASISLEAYEWYAPNVGLVKSVVTIKKLEKKESKYSEHLNYQLESFKP